MQCASESLWNHDLFVRTLRQLVDNQETDEILSCSVEIASVLLKADRGILWLLSQRELVAKHEFCATRSVLQKNMTIPEKHSSKILVELKTWRILMMRFCPFLMS